MPVGAAPPRTLVVPRSQRSRAPSSTSPRHASIQFNVLRPRPYQLPDSPNSSVYSHRTSSFRYRPRQSCAPEGSCSVRASGLAFIQVLLPPPLKTRCMTTPRGLCLPASPKVRTSALFEYIRQVGHTHCRVSWHPFAPQRPALPPAACTGPPPTARGRQTIATSRSRSLECPARNGSHDIPASGRSVRCRRFYSLAKRLLTSVPVCHYVRLWCVCNFAFGWSSTLLSRRVQDERCIF